MLLFPNSSLEIWTGESFLTVGRSDTGQYRGPPSYQYWGPSDLWFQGIMDLGTLEDVPFGSSTGSHTHVTVKVALLAV